MNAIPVPKNFKEDKNIKIWVDEAIWGHRFYDDQTPWLVFLEFLCVFRARHKTGNALNEPRQEGIHENIRYRVPKLLPLRETRF